MRRKLTRTLDSNVREACRALAAALVTATAVATYVPQAYGASLRLMSMNIAEDTGAPSASDGNAWNYTAGQPRRARAAQVVADTAPDIFGIEEARSNQVADLSGTNLLASSPATLSAAPTAATPACTKASSTARIASRGSNRAFSG
jgi:hypothetical protein